MRLAHNVLYFHCWPFTFVKDGAAISTKANRWLSPVMCVLLYAAMLILAGLTQAAVAVPAKVAAGDSHTVAILEDGTLWAWGYNGDGQLGDGTTNNGISPVQVGVATNWNSVVAGYTHTVALKSDGTLWAWGWNNSGQLGDGTTTDSLSPIQIGVATNWSSVAAGYLHTVALKSDGTLWAWGENGSNQLGDGTREFYLEALKAPKPDVILASLPPIESAANAVRYAQPRKIPVCQLCSETGGNIRGKAPNGSPCTCATPTCRFYYPKTNQTVLPTRPYTTGNSL
jgi:hypothetical protein